MIDILPAPLVAEPLDDTYLLRFPLLSGLDGFAHAVTMRPWNMAPHQGPQAELAIARRRRICASLGLDFDRLTAAEQIHSGHVLRVLPGDVGLGREGRHTAFRFLDGLVTDLPGVPLIMFSADCPLIMAVDPIRRALGLVHASWRGTIARITEVMVRQMQREFGSKSEDLQCAICPCAGPQRYEVGEEIRRIAAVLLEGGERFFVPSGDRWLLNLRAANADQLVRCGVRPESIHVAAECTISDERFYSHRREGEKTGRFALMAGFR